MFNVRTDLAIEAREARGEQISGVDVINAGDEQVKITRVKILNEQAANELGKPVGTYITLEIPGLRMNDKEVYERVCAALSEEIRAIAGFDKERTTLVAGLGNWNITPDSIGPKVVKSLLVTRHLFEHMPSEVGEGVSPVCGVAPGVLGITGVETGEILRGIVERVSPGLVIAVDALASRRLERVGTTIQISDTGISPGSGVGNQRKELSAQTLGVPIIAIGIPMVVDAATIASDAIDMAVDALISETDEGSGFYKTLKELDRGQKYSLITEVLSSNVGDLMVTPKEVDELSGRVSKIIANGINLALHEGFSLEDIEKYFAN